MAQQITFWWDGHLITREVLGTSGNWRLVNVGHLAWIRSWTLHPNGPDMVTEERA